MSQPSVDPTLLVCVSDGVFGTGFFTGGELADIDGEQATYWAENTPDQPIRLSQDLTHFDERLVHGLIVSKIIILRDNGFVQIFLENEDVCENEATNVVTLQLASYTLKKANV